MLFSTHFASVQLHSIQVSLGFRGGSKSHIGGVVVGVDVVDVVEVDVDVVGVGVVDDVGVGIVDVVVVEVGILVEQGLLFISSVQLALQITSKHKVPFKEMPL